MEEGDVVEMVLEVCNQLRGKGDFGDEQNNRLIFRECLAGELDIDICFAGAGDAMEEDGIGVVSIYFFDGMFLSGIERVILLLCS